MVCSELRRVHFVMMALMITFIFWAVAAYPSEDSPDKFETTVSFSPHGECQQMAIDLIKGAHETLDVAVYSINNKAIVAALEDALKAKVKIRILTDHIEAGSNKNTTMKLSRDGFALKLHSVDRIMHNKFAVADDHKVIEGSFNWTEPAQNSNAENCLVTDDPDVVGAYGDQFERVLWPENTQSKSDVHLKAIEEKLKAVKK